MHKGIWKHSSVGRSVSRRKFLSLTALPASAHSPARQRVGAATPFAASRSTVAIFQAHVLGRLEGVRTGVRAKDRDEGQP